MVGDGDLVVLTFKVAQYCCAFRAGKVQEIVAIPATTKVPGQPSILEGFLNLRGIILPVVRMATFFNLPFQTSLYTPVIVVRNRHGSIGFLVSEVESVQEIDGGELRELAADHTANEYAEAEFATDGHTVTLLDCERLLLAEESRRISELQGQVQERLQALGAVKQ